MNFFKKLYHFLGGIHLAICLIGTVALLVVAGTVIESRTDSHRFAAQLTYGHPLFSILLWLFFVNILFAALRRWPFKTRHIPFLITHWGLLMILGGMLVKSYYGTQGSMGVMEGSASQQIFQKDTYVVSLEKQNPATKHHYEIKKGVFGGYHHNLKGDESNDPFPELSIHLIGYAPNSREKLESWIKGDQLVISGLTPFQVHPWKEGKDKLPLSGRVKLDQGDGEPWDVVALRASDVQTAANRLSNTRTPTLAFIQDHHGDVYFFAFDGNGHVHTEPFRNDNLSTLIAYDGGYRGYASQAKLPLPAKRQSTAETLHVLAAQLREGLGSPSELAPPLLLLHRACEHAGVDFADTCLQFLSVWNKTQGWIYPKDTPLPPELEKVIAGIDWSTIPENDRNACRLIITLFDELEPAIKQEIDLTEVLKRKGWPLALHDEDNPTALLTTLTQQVFAAVQQLGPGENIALKGEQPDSARMLSAYLRVYDIHLSKVMPSPIATSSQAEIICLECPLTARRIEQRSREKLEDNLPMITLQIKEGEHSEIVTLTYDPYGTGLKWPIMGGKYLIRFQPEYKTIPYRVRLRQARQINYANSQQPYSFESDLIFSSADKPSLEKTISMNNVHETWEGYRFYLSNIAPPGDDAVKRIQLIVNHDPAKYWLTYPGAVILSLGILLLFWLWPYSLKLPK